MTKPFRITRNGICQPNENPTFYLGFKGFATTTGVAGFGIGNLETASIEAVHVVDDSAIKVVRTEAINENAHAEGINDVIVRTLLVENHAVLHSRATAIFDVNAQIFADVFGLLGEHGADVIGCALSEIDQRFDWNIDFHLG
jgi:hypothetical protein